MPCNTCIHPDKSKMDKGRAFDGRRAYRCPDCGEIWTEGLQDRQQKFSDQRPGFQFKDTGSSRKTR